jgi:hypothetical protein
MVQRNDYPSTTDMVVIDWHHSGPFDNPDASARAAYLGASSAPDTYFDGIDNVLGAGDSVSTYGTYIGIINDHYDNQWSQLIIHDPEMSLDLPSMIGTITYTVEVAPGETIVNPQDVTLRSAVYEDFIFQCCEPVTGNTNWNHIGRALGTEHTLTISQAGETQPYTGTFAINASWDPDNLSAVGFVQRDTNRYVLQAGAPCPTYGVSVQNLGPSIAVDNDPVDFEVEVTYTGCTPDDVTVTLDESGLPADWDAEIVVGAMTFPNSTTFPNMSEGQTQPYKVRIIPGATPALAYVGARTEPSQLPARGVTKTYGVFGNTPGILYVNDDAGANTQPLFENAIANAGFFSLTHDVDTQGDPTSEELTGWDAVVWNTGSPQTNTISLANQADLISLLNGGGRVFVNSQGLMNEHDGTDFVQNYLRVSSFSEQRAGHCDGVPGDPVGDGLSFDVSQGFDLSDVITPSAGGIVWLIGDPGNVAVRYDDGNFKTAFMTPRLERIPVGDAELVIERVLDWFFQSNPTDVWPVVASESGLSLGQNAPNPFTASTSVRFTVPAPGPVSLEIFDVTGRRVARILDRTLPAGSHAAAWDGRDASGSRVASGIYLYRLRAAGESLSKEMVLRR